MKDDSPLTAQWLADNTKLVHYLLLRRGIRQDWYPDYEDLVQDVFCVILQNVEKYDSTRAQKGPFLNLMITKTLGADVSASERGRKETTHVQIQDAENLLPPYLDDIEHTIYVEREFSKLTEVQQMEALGYTFKEIGEQVGLSPDYLRNKKGLATRGR